MCVVIQKRADVCQWLLGWKVERTHFQGRSQRSWCRSGVAVADGHRTCARPCAGRCASIILINFPNSVSTVFIPILWIRRLTLRRGKKCAQGCTARSSAAQRPGQSGSRLSPVTEAGLKGSRGRWRWGPSLGRRWAGFWAPHLWSLCETPGRTVQDPAVEGPRLTQGVGKEECLGKATAEGVGGVEGKSVMRGLRHLLTGDRGMAW